MYRQHGAGAGAEQPYQLNANAGMSPFGQAHFASPMYSLDPNLQGSPQSQHLQPGAGSHGRSSNDFARSMQPPSGSSPRMRSTSPGHEPGSNYRPTDRSLPSKDVTADTLTQAFVDFILYCNPRFPQDVDTAALRMGFESPPKSDGKDFITWDLFELIQKLDAKEIKTWNQLALGLGVEAPDVSKGQSVQKVQQYTVRLKRWMRAMHIDAFFEYLYGKEHQYFLDVPPPDDPYPPNGRDGVMAEEDLAIRALDPVFRPKRGRRRNSETEASDPPAHESASKQQRSMLSFSAHPDNRSDPWAVASTVTPQNFAPWSARAPASAMSIAGPSHLRWQLGHAQTPSTPHPMSAIPTSMSAHIEAAFDGEPKSAVAPSARKRRKHGPAVSSAWPSSNAPGAKPRGRPPAHRNVQDGPFSTFPADPSNSKGRVQTDTKPTTSAHSPPETASADNRRQSEGRPGRLSLQVPPHTGAPVRLATPPALQVNGEVRELETRSDSDDPTRGFAAPATRGAPIEAQRLAQATATTPRAIPRFSFESLKRVLTSDLLRADLHGRPHRLSGEDAKRLADAMLDRLNAPRADSPTDGGKADLARLSAATWLGVADQASVPPFHAAASTGHGKRIAVTRFRTNHDGYEEIVPSSTSSSSSSAGGDAAEIKEIFDVQWHASMGGCIGAFEMKGLTLSSPSSSTAPSSNPVIATTLETTHDLVMRKAIEAIYKLDRHGWIDDSMREIAVSAAAAAALSSSGAGAGAGAGVVVPSDEAIDWKAKCKAMEFAAHVARGEVERVRKRICERVIDAVL